MTTKIQSGLYKFIGKNSLGYRHGKTYKLKIKQANIAWMRGRRAGISPISIRRFERHPFWGFALCPYGSEQAFWDNWEQVK